MFPLEPRWSRWVRRLGIAFALALALGYVPHHIYGGTGLARLIELRHRLADLRSRNEAMRVEHVRLRSQAAALKNDPRALERVARDELGLIKSGEIVYQIQEDAAP